MRRNGKKWLAALMLVSLLSGCLPAGASAEKKLTWPSHVKVVGESMFEGDTSIETVVLPEGVEGIGSRAFAGSSLKEIYLPSTLDMTKVEPDAFGTIRPIIDVYPAVHAPVGSDAYNWAREKGLQVEFRALLIGEKTFEDEEEKPAIRNVADVNNLSKKLKSVFGYTGDPYTIVTGIDYSYEMIHSAIEDTFAGARDQDISLFFIATHGSSLDGGLVMPYLGESNYTRKLTFDVLAGWLSNVPGRVIVILESCYAGYAIYSPEIQENGIKGNGIQIMNNTKDDSTVLRDQDFAEQAVQAFAEKDPGIRVIQQPGDSSDGMRKKSGAMRIENKFYVLAASRHNETSFGYVGTEAYKGNVFTIWLTQGIGNKTNSPADISLKDGMLTLDELYQYIKIKSDKRDPRLLIGGVQYYQHVQCYPKDCNLVCFLLR